MKRAAMVAVVLAAAACSKAPEVPDAGPAPWKPGTTYQTARSVSARGFLDRRGLIHAHSVYSHDACDNQPVNDAGARDAQCFEDFRNGLCGAMHDFVFLTDHRDAFDDHEYPELLLYRADRGDVLIEHGAGPTANRMSCGNGAPAPLVLGGNETKMMPVGLERHAEGRGNTYSDVSDAGIEKIHAAGGLAIMAHTEGVEPGVLTSVGLDGFEMYNLHANTFKNLGISAEWALKIDAKMFDGLPDPNLFLIGFNLEDPAYLERWGTVLSRGVQRVTTMGTDCHRNSLPQLAQDGERIDSYRRMMSMFSNHLLVRDGTVDDRALKEALRAGRLYGAFEFLGYPVGFDYVARAGEVVTEMGGTVAVGASLEVTRPAVERLAADAEAPTVTLKLYRAKEGGWDEVASGSDAKLTYVATQPGAYRAEVRMVPKHLRAYAGRRLDLLKPERPWVYSNAIYVR